MKNIQIGKELLTATICFIFGTLVGVFGASVFAPVFSFANGPIFGEIIGPIVLVIREEGVGNNVDLAVGILDGMNVGALLGGIIGLVVGLIVWLDSPRPVYLLAGGTIGALVLGPAVGSLFGGAVGGILAYASGTIVQTPGIMLYGAIVGGMIGIILFIANSIFVKLLVKSEKKQRQKTSAKLPSSTPRKYSPAPEGSKKFLLLALSFLVSIIGIIIGIIYIQRPDSASQRFAKEVFIAVIAGFVVPLVLPVVLLFLVELI